MNDQVQMIQCSFLLSQGESATGLTRSVRRTLGDFNSTEKRWREMKKSNFSPGINFKQRFLYIYTQIIRFLFGYTRKMCNFA